MSLVTLNVCVVRGHAVRPDPVWLLSARRQPRVSERRRRAQLRLPHAGVCQVQHGPDQQRALGCIIRTRFQHSGGQLRARLRREAAVRLSDAAAPGGAAVRQSGGCAGMSALSESPALIGRAALLPQLRVLLPHPVTAQLPHSARTHLGGFRLSVQKRLLQILPVFSEAHTARRTELPSHLPYELGRGWIAPAARETVWHGPPSPSPVLPTQPPLYGVPGVFGSRAGSDELGGAVRGVRGQRSMSALWGAHLRGLQGLL